MVLPYGMNMWVRCFPPPSRTDVLGMRQECLVCLDDTRDIGTVWPLQLNKLKDALLDVLSSLANEPTCPGFTPLPSSHLSTTRVVHHASRLLDVDPHTGHEFPLVASPPCLLLNDSWEYGLRCTTAVEPRSSWAVKCSTSLSVCDICLEMHRLHQATIWTVTRIKHNRFEDRHITVGIWTPGVSKLVYLEWMDEPVLGMNRRGSYPDDVHLPATHRLDIPCYFGQACLFAWQRDAGLRREVLLLASAVLFVTCFFTQATRTLRSTRLTPPCLRFCQSLFFLLRADSTVYSTHFCKCCFVDSSSWLIAMNGDDSFELVLACH